MIIMQTSMAPEAVVSHYSILCIVSVILEIFLVKPTCTEALEACFRF